jgi:hypothetical protein
VPLFFPSTFHRNFPPPHGLIFCFHPLSHSFPATFDHV